jgi:hypothetical protein
MGPAQPLRSRASRGEVIAITHEIVAITHEVVAIRRRSCWHQEVKSLVSGGKVTGIRK